MAYKPSSFVSVDDKIWCIADAKTGFIFKFCVYTGKSGAWPYDWSSRWKLGIFDNFFTSVPLLEKLDEKGLFSCGTVRATRKHLPEFIKTKPKSEATNSKKVQLKRGQYQYQTKGHVAATKWMDNNMHILLCATLCGMFCWFSHTKIKCRFVFETIKNLVSIFNHEYKYYNLSQLWAISVNIRS